ncbi:hypothetical protein GCM10009616_38000 [Microlunatus lacustris]
MCDPDLRVRLETRPRQGVHLDLLVADPVDGSASAIELKYLTDRWDGEVSGESFRLLRQAAQDIRAYDAVKDIERVEQVVTSGYATAGLVLVLTNDPSYWRAPDHGRATNADAFRLHENGLLAGSRRWGPLTGSGTSKGRSEAVNLAGEYTLRWQDYSFLNGPRGRFRFLGVAVP